MTRQKGWPTQTLNCPRSSGFGCLVRGSCAQRNTRRALPRGRGVMGMRPLNCGPLALKRGDGRIMEWTPDGQEYPCITILDGGGFLWLRRPSSRASDEPDVMVDDVSCQRSNQDTAAELYFAIMQSKRKDVIRFREEYMR